MAIAAASLSLPWATTYDPWSWIVWGREVTHLDLQTLDGPSWKPLPVLVTAVLSLTGHAAPAGWLVVARSGGLLALAGAYALGRRLAGPVAGATALAALALDVSFDRFAWLGDSEGLLVAALLFAIERQLAGRHRTTLLLGTLAALLRPEVWPFLAVYGAWLGWREPDSRKLVIGAGVTIVFLWFAPELWGSGQIWRSADRAQQPTAQAATFAHDPALEVMRRARVMLVGPVKAAAIVALLFALARFRTRLSRASLVLTGGAAAWLGLVALMTTHGFSGNERYVIPPVAVMCALAGVGAAAAADVVRALLAGGARWRAIAVLALIAIAAGSAPFVAANAQAIGRDAAVLEYQASLRSGIESAVARLGGAARVRACGPSATEDYSVPMLAWYLDEHIGAIFLDAPPRGTVFQARPTPNGSPDPPVVRGELRRRFRSGPVRVYERCALARDG